MIQNINLGAAPNDKTGDKARVAGQKINSNFAYLEAKIDNKSYLKTETGFTLVDQDLTLNIGWEWVINNIDYTNPSAVVINIPFSAIGKSRIDLIVCNSSNTFSRITGEESLFTPNAPAVPLNTVLATFFTVSDGVVGTPSIPITIQDLLEKLDRGGYAGTAQDLKDEIDEILLPDQILVYGEAPVTAGTINIAAGAFIWRLNKVEYTNPIYSNVISPAANGYTRFDLFCVNASGTLEKVVGDEEIGVAPKPSPNQGTLEAFFIEINGAIVSDPIPVSSPGGVKKYIQQAEFASVSELRTGVINFVILETIQNKILLSGNATELRSISHYFNPYLFLGRDLYLINEGTVDCLIKHLYAGQGAYTFSFPNEDDFTLHPKEQIHFKLKITTSGHGIYQYVGIISSTIPNATDTIAGTVKTDVTKTNPVVYVKETVDTLLDAKANFFLDIKTITGITYNVILEDILSELVYAGTLPMNVIIPNSSTIDFPIGTTFYTLGTNTGIITASGAAGVTLNVKAGISLSAIRNEVRQYTKIGTNTWSVRGDLNLGAVTQQELSYLQGATSNLQAQINAKTALSGGIANRLMMWLNATQATVSRIWDTGAFLGIGTANTPTKDITLGNQANREIGVEQSSSLTKGRDLVVKAGRTINFIDNANFNIDQGSATSMSINKISKDKYVTLGVNIYKQTAGVGSFNAITSSISSTPSRNVRVNHFNNDVYFLADLAPPDYVLKLYKQTAGVGNINNVIVPFSTSIIALAVNYTTLDVFISNDFNIYKQTAGVGAFELYYTGITYIASIEIDYYNNDIYFSYGAISGVYKQTAGVGNFEFIISFPQYVNTYNNSSFLSLNCENKDLFFSANNGNNSLWKLVGGLGAWIVQTSIVNVWYGIYVDESTKNVYAFNPTIYLQINAAEGLDNLDGGTLKLGSGTGKGTGQSRFEIYTGQKTTSGTDMQIETLREYIDENGYHVYTSMPVYADNAAAITAGLPVGCKYRNTTGDLKIVY